MLQKPVAIDSDETWDTLVRKTKTLVGEVLVEILLERLDFLGGLHRAEP